MNVLTVNEIIRIARDTNPKLSLSNIAIGYIQSLLHPLANLADDILVKHITDWALTIPYNLIASQMQVILENNLAKDDMFEYLISELLQLVENITLDYEDDVMTPWDIQSAISNHDKLTLLFNIKEGSEQLPLSVTINNKSFIHMLSEDFAFGLLLFSLPTVGNYEFNMTMFGVPFGRDIPARFNENKLDPGYTVEVSGRKYSFTTADFMQGFATGALWAGVDHHGYWKNLIYRSYSQINNELIERAITF